MLGVSTFVHVRVSVEHAGMDMWMGVVVSPPPPQEQASRENYDDHADRNLRTLKQAGRKLAREQQQGNSEHEQCGCMPDAPGQPEHRRRVGRLYCPGTGPWSTQRSGDRDQLHAEHPAARPRRRSSHHSNPNISLLDGAEVSWCSSRPKITGRAVDRNYFPSMSTNRLSQSASAYLQSAAHQPIQWFPWGTEAFAAAQAQNKPVLLDIGAVWCHWCHVMDGESYENPDLADFLNQNFVCIKVDRDERPDVDARYQRAVQTLTQQGGWPLTAFLTPKGEVFFGGTYFPPDDKYGRPWLPLRPGERAGHLSCAARAGAGAGAGDQPRHRGES